MALPLSPGTYFDEVTKNADEWLFKDRRIVVE